MMRENEKERLAYYYRETIPAEVYFDNVAQMT